MSLYNDRYGLFKNHPHYVFSTATPTSCNFYTRRINTPEYGRKYKNYITEDEARNVSDEVVQTVLDQDTRSRLYEQTTSYHELPVALRNIDRLASQVQEADRMYAERKLKNNDIIKNTIEKYSGDKVNAGTVKMLEGYMNRSNVSENTSKNTVKIGTKGNSVNRVRFTDIPEANTYNGSVKEGYTYNSKITESDTDEMYMNILKSRAKMVAEHVSNNKFYSKWSENWKLLNYNLKRNKYLFNRLDQSDADIAYVINKGDEVNFRIRDEIRYVPVNIYQYVLYHEMAHMSTTELQHTPKFHELLNILSFAAFELGLIDIRRTTKEYWNTNGQPILCRAALQDEIIVGADWLIQANPGHTEYFEEIIKTVENMSE